MRVVHPMSVQRLIVLLLCVVAPIAASSNAPTMTQTELDALLKRVESNLGDLRSLRAPFEQEKHLSIFKDVVRSTGTLFFALPDRVRIQMDGPFESVLVTDGRSVAQFERVDGSWERIRSGGQPVILAVTSQIASWLKGNFSTQTEIYTITGEPGESPRLVLTPTDAEFAKRIARIEITLAPDLASVTRIEIREPGGDFTALIFTGQERDVDLPDDLFSTNASQPAPTGRVRTEPAEID